MRQLAMTPGDADARYQQVGVVCAVNPGMISSPAQQAYHDGLPADERAELDRSVCRLGGEILVTSGFCSIGKTTGVEWRVYSQRPGAPEAN